MIITNAPDLSTVNYACYKNRSDPGTYNPLEVRYDDDGKILTIGGNDGDEKYITFYHMESVIFGDSNVADNCSF